MEGESMANANLTKEDKKRVRIVEALLEDNLLLTFHKKFSEQDHDINRKLGLAAWPRAFFEVKGNGRPLPYAEQEARNLTLKEIAYTNPMIYWWIQSTFAKDIFDGDVARYITDVFEISGKKSGGAVWKRIIDTRHKFGKSVAVFTGQDFWNNGQYFVYGLPVGPHKPDTYTAYRTVDLTEHVASMYLSPDSGFLCPGCGLTIRYEYIRGRWIDPHIDYVPTAARGNAVRQLVPFYTCSNVEAKVIVGDVDSLVVFVDTMSYAGYGTKTYQQLVIDKNKYETKPLITKKSAVAAIGEATFDYVQVSKPAPTLVPTVEYRSEHVSRLWDHPDRLITIKGGGFIPARDGSGWF